MCSGNSISCVLKTEGINWKHKLFYSLLNIHKRYWIRLSVIRYSVQARSHLILASNNLDSRRQDIHPGQQFHTSRKESEDLRTPLCHLIHLISDLKCDLDLYDLSACAIYQPVNWKFSNDKDGGKKGTQEFHMNFIVQFTGKRSRK